MNKFLRFTYSFLAVGVTALVAAFFSNQAMQTFYPSLNMPPFSPPDYVFAPVWSVLYTLMIVSYYIILNSADSIKLQNANLLFLGQLFLQMLWSYMFFKTASFAPALIVIVLMIWTVYKMIEKFKTINKSAGNMLYPYLLWLIYAAYLNAAIAYLNAN
ncbi:MAG: tryptophan-rich sensory protein [Alphaproteobacteria bacterium]|nr:tryptophan-rich sensory protein [Alphaproteobacteria bacterium]